MPAVDSFRINDTFYSWTSSKFLVANVSFEGITAMAYEMKRDVKTVYGARRDGLPMGRTSGKITIGDVTLSIFPDSWDIFTSILTPFGLGSFGDAVFPMMLQRIEPVAPLSGTSPVLTTSFEQCRVTGYKHSGAEGTDESIIEVTLSALNITENGKSLASIVRSIG